MALEQIVRDKRAAVAARKIERPLSTFMGELQRSSRSFEAAVGEVRTSFILECKKASPSQGLIRDDFDPAAIATVYGQHASAISVLTDEPYFQGRHAYLTAVSEAVALPVLCKDFVVDSYQIYEARHHGADAILLMASVLDVETLKHCLEVCREVWLDPLVEAHDEDELAMARDVGARVIGINNRNLKTLEIDLATTETLAPRLPLAYPCISESGILSHRDVLRLRHHVDGFLVGTAIMRQPSIATAMRELIFGRVKVCGLTAGDQARAAWNAGATHGGLMLWGPSKRAVTPSQAAQIQAAAEDLAWVGVFVDESAEHVAHLAAQLRLSAVQLHGSEAADDIAALRPLLPPGCEIWKAVRVGGAAGTAVPLRASLGVDRVLVDTYKRGVAGGSGESFDWQLLDGHPEKHEIILSGGLRPGNAAAADGVGCWALDLSSGVESAPGQKDADRLKALFAALRGGSERYHGPAPTGQACSHSDGDR